MEVIDTDMANNQVEKFEEDWTRMWKPQPTFASPDPDFRNWKSVIEWKRIFWNKFLLSFSLWDIFANLSISCGYRSRFIALLDYLKPCFCKLFVFDECRLSVQKTLSISQESGDKQTTVRHQTSNCCTIKSWGSEVSP